MRDKTAAHAPRKARARGTPPLRLVALTIVGLVAACGPNLHVVPIANPVTSMADPVEIRTPNPNYSHWQDVEYWCDQSRATDCLDSFLRLEAATPELIVVRYRRVGLGVDEVRPDPEKVGRLIELELWTSEGVQVRGRLHERFDTEPRSPVRYVQEVAVESNRVRYTVQGDGSVVARPELDYGTEVRQYNRVSGSSYIVFERPGLLTPQTRWVELRAPGRGLFGREQRWRWTFDGGQPQNVVLSRSPELDRPDLAREGPVHRKAPR